MSAKNTSNEKSVHNFWIRPQYLAAPYNIMSEGNAIQ